MKTKQNMGSYVVFFDGVCNLCHSSVLFINKHDYKKRFKFSSLQSETASKMFDKYNLKNNFKSIVFFENGSFYFESTAVLRIARLLRFPVNLLYVFVIVPPFIRNYIYRFIAKKRYKWFGKRDKCLVTSDLHSDIFV